MTYANDVQARFFCIDFGTPAPGTAAVGVYRVDGTVADIIIDTVTAHDILDTMYKHVDYCEDGYYRFNLEEQRKYDAPRFSQLAQASVWPAGAKVPA